MTQHDTIHHTPHHITGRKHGTIATRPHAAGIAAALMALGLPAPAQAQASTAAAQETALKEVQVRARREGGYKAEKASSAKFTRPLLDTPQTLSVIRREVLEEQEATTLQEALRNTPGVTLLLGEGGNSNGKDNVFMRGFDTTGNIFIDGVRNLGSSVRDTFNIEQIEIVKGASGSEYGRAAPSGSINMSTKLPFAGDLSQARLSTGTADDNRATVDMNRQLDATTALRLNAMAQNRGVAGRDYVRNKGVGIAPSIAFGLGTSTRVLADMQVLRYDNRPDGGVPTIGLPGYYSALLAAAGITRFPAVDSSNFYGSLGDFSKTDLDQATLRLEHDLSPGTTVRHITRAGRSSIDQLLTGTGAIVGDGSGANAVARPDLWTWTASRSRQLRWQDNRLLTHQTSVTTAFDTGALRHALNAGVELIHEKQTTKGRTGAGTVPPADLYAPDVNDPVTGQAIRYTGQLNKGTTRTLAIYAFDSIDLNPQWQLTGGLRLDRYRSANDNTSAPAAATGLQTLTSLRSSGTLLSTKLGFNFKPLEHGSLYAGVSTSQQPPGGSNFALSATEGNINNSSMDPSKATNLEVGTKWDILDRRLLLTGALFQTTVRNDLGTIDPVTGVVTQYGRKQVKGVELGAVGQITPAWAISAGLAHMSTKVQQGTATQTGARLNWSPRLSFTSWTTYRFRNGLTVGGGARYMDRLARQVSNATVPAITNMPEAQAYWVYDGFMAYDVNSQLRLQLNIYNLADRKYVASLNSNGGRYIPGAARSARLIATLKF
ncbi:TonB-dependent receptor Fiu [Delftia tsuruhatensis]|uniref:catecholate siderophore receptor Fiu n=1 Tax=Delftia tsuruhatensis TaxID=180282 RepID=UPI001E6D864C|nr:catecholate siderophore receptor Fiu [Delftia tsuruhatensis]CAB5710849.1 TonB-dependent receptor Fiu [Delftia tsuruhatensis]CAC9692283.1 TonB-dependent receptor Fiu [Delftia tsuruhatensis]